MHTIGTLLYIVTVDASSLTVSRAVVSWELVKVSRLEPVVVVVDGPHHAGPRLLEHEVSFSLSRHLLASLVQQTHGDAEEREALQQKIC